MVKHSSLAILFFLIFSIPLPAQNDNKLAAEASKLARQAKSLWKDNKYAEAEELYFKSWSLSPLCYELDEFARLRLKIGDIKGANRVWNTIIKNAPNECKGWMYYSMVSNNFESGDVLAGIETTIEALNLYRGKKPTEEIWFYCTTVPQVIFSTDDRRSLEKILEIVKTMPEDKKYNIAGGAKSVIGFYLNLLDEKFDEAIQTLEDLKEGKRSFFRSGDWAKANLPTAYVFKGDFDKGELSIKEFVKKND